MINIPSIKSALQKHQNILIPAFLLLSAIFIYWPSHDVMPFLSQGDIGRELYGFSMTAAEHTPYKDYYYQYGPIMPYYYALFIKIFGIKITTFLLGRTILNIISGFLIFFILRMLVTPLPAILAALWFWVFNPEFVHTFNHTGGTTVTIILLYFVLKYIHAPNQSWLYLMALGLLTLLLIKINIGLAIFMTLTAIIFTKDLQDKKPVKDSLYSTGILALAVLISLAIYWLLFSALPGYYIKQCFPIFPGYGQFKNSNIFENLSLYPKIIITTLTVAQDLSSLSTFPNAINFNCLLIIFSIAGGALGYDFIRN